LLQNACKYRLVNDSSRSLGFEYFGIEELKIGKESNKRDHIDVHWAIGSHFIFLSLANDSIADAQHRFKPKEKPSNLFEGLSI